MNAEQFTDELGTRVQKECKRWFDADQCPTCGTQYRYRKEWIARTPTDKYNDSTNGETLGCRAGHEWRRDAVWPNDSRIMELAGLLHEEET